MMTDYIPSKQEQTRNCGIKTDHKNCASRWSLTHCNMMHGTHKTKYSITNLSNPPRVRNVSDKICRENQNTILYKLLLRFENRVFYEKCGKIP